MKKILIFVATLFIGMTLSAQSAKVVTEILDSPKITYGQACYLSATAQNLIKDTDSYADAIAALSAKNQIPANVSDPSEEIKLANLAAVYTKIFGLKGGLWYRCTKGSPRYALKLLKADGIVPQNTDPSKVLSGSEALSLFTSCTEKYGDNQLSEKL